MAAHGASASKRRAWGGVGIDLGWRTFSWSGSKSRWTRQRNGVANGHARVVVGWEAKALDVLARIIGPRYQRVTATLVSRFAPWARDRGDVHHAA